MGWCAPSVEGRAPQVPSGSRALTCNPGTPCAQTCSAEGPQRKCSQAPEVVSLTAKWLPEVTEISQRGLETPSQHDDGQPDILNNSNQEESHHNPFPGDFCQDPTRRKLNLQQNVSGKWFWLPFTSPSPYKAKCQFILICFCEKHLF